MYEDLKNQQQKEKYCSPIRTRHTVDSDGLDSMEDKLDSCAIACIIFFAIAGIFICCGLCAGIKTRYKDLNRAYLWCFKGTFINTFKRDSFQFIFHCDKRIRCKIL